MMKRSSGDTGEVRSTAVTVGVALAANLVIAAAKAVGGVFAGSPALLSEAAHSVADSINEVFLFASLRRSGRGADRVHPFGYGKERYFWSLLAAGRPLGHLRRPGWCPAGPLPRSRSLPLSCARTSTPLTGGCTSVRHPPPAGPSNPAVPRLPSRGRGPG